MAISTAVKAFAKKFANQIIDDNVAIFAGAGLSAGAGFVDWEGLLAPLAGELNLDIARERDHLVRLAQYSQNHKNGNRHHLHQVLITAFPVLHDPSDNHRVLARIPISTYWTTNYDRLVETALRDVKKRVDVKHAESQLPHSLLRRDAVVYKMHGDVEHPQDAVLTRDDYEGYASKRAGFLSALSGDLTGKTFLFLGFSFTDPNLDYVLSQVRQRYQQSQREHYCLLRRPKRAEFSNDGEFEYARVRQQHFVRDLGRYNITVLEIDEYADVTETLREIERYYRRRSVFIGGSADDYRPWTGHDAEAFFRALGAMLVDMNYRIVSGFGLGVGNALISGAIERAYSQGNIHLDEFLDVRPFPRAIPDATRRAEVWDTFRKELLRIPGIALFLFGNKIVNDAIVPADGLVKEFEIARAQGLILIPVGGTGSVAKELAEKVLADFDAYFPGGDPTMKRFIEELNKPTERLESYLNTIAEAIKYLTNR